MENIKTKLKFSKSLVSGAFVGFVTRDTKTGIIKGVRENSPLPKQVCILSTELAPVVEEGVLYDVEMKPMREKNGFVVTSAEPHLFEATIKTVIVKHAVYRVEVSFGNKTIIYNPMDGVNDNVKTISGVVGVLTSRKDINNQMEVIAKFEKSANILLTVYEQDGYYVPRNKR